MFNKNLLLILLIVATKMNSMEPTAATKSQPPTLVLKHKKLSPDKLHFPTDPAFEQKSVYQLHALFEQVDSFSCVYRTLFHVRCMEIANKRSKKGLSFEKSLKELFLNEGMIKKTYLRIKNYLDTERPAFDQSTGVALGYLPEICYLKLKKLRGKILLTLLEDDGRITVMHDKKAPASNPLLYTAEFMESLLTTPFDECKTSIDQSVEMRHQLLKLKKPFALAHFVCRFPFHAFLVTMRTDNASKISSYVVDSGNYNAFTDSRYKVFVEKIVSIVEAHNASQEVAKTKAT